MGCKFKSEQEKNNKETAYRKWGVDFNHDLDDAPGDFLVVDVLQGVFDCELGDADYGGGRMNCAASWAS